MLIFIGPKSNPVHSHEMLDTFNGYIKEAERIRAANPEIEKAHDVVGNVVQDQVQRPCVRLEEI